MGRIIVLRRALNRHINATLSRKGNFVEFFEGKANPRNQR